MREKLLLLFRSVTVSPGTTPQASLHNAARLMTACSIRVIHNEDVLQIYLDSCMTVGSGESLGTAIRRKS